MSERNYGKRKEPTTLGDIYREGTTPSIATQKGFLILLNIFIVGMCSFLIWFIWDGTEQGMVEGAPFIAVAVLAVAVITCVFAIVFFTIYTFVTLQGDIEYEIKGEVQLDIAYDPWDAFRYNPFGSISALVTVGGIVVLVLVILLTSGSPSGISLYAVAMSSALVLKNTFSKRHYVFTETGFGYILFGFRPMTVYMSWERFSGFEIGEGKVRLFPKRNRAILGLFFPRKIPVLDDLEDARFILQQYLSES